MWPLIVNKNHSFNLLGSFYHFYTNSSAADLNISDIFDKPAANKNKVCKWTLS